MNYQDAGVDIVKGDLFVENKINDEDKTQK